MVGASAALLPPSRSATARAGTAALSAEASAAFSALTVAHQRPGGALAAPKRTVPVGGRAIGGHTVARLRVCPDSGQLLWTDMGPVAREGEEVGEPEQLEGDAAPHVAVLVRLSDDQGGNVDAVRSKLGGQALFCGALVRTFGGTDAAAATTIFCEVLSTHSTATSLAAGCWSTWSGR